MASPCRWPATTSRPSFTSIQVTPSFSATSAQHVDADEIALRRGAETQLIEIKAQRVLDPDVAAVLRSQFGIERLKQISPVLPVLSRQDMRVPFITCEEMLQYNAGLEPGPVGTGAPL